MYQRFGHLFDEIIALQEEIWEDMGFNDSEQLQAVYDECEEIRSSLFLILSLIDEIY